LRVETQRDINRRSRAVTIILTLDQAAQRASITRRTLERLRAEGEAPPVIQLSKRRVGIAESDLERWLESRRRSVPGQAVERS
jgi:predicted DNA-binding transcriptional regulator AlpA